MSAPRQHEIDNHQEMLGLIFGFWVSQVVGTVAALSVADHLSNRPMTAAELAEAEGSDLDATFRLLRACAALKLMTYDRSDGRFTGTALLDTLRNGSPNSLRNLALSQTATAHWATWSRFPDTVRTGDVQIEAALGCDVWTYFEKNPDEAQLFGASMTELSTPVILEAATLIDTTEVEVVADIGGANGAFVHELLDRNPELRGVVFDRPPALPGAEIDAKQRGLGDRASRVGGDFFESVPAADLYLIKYILHDWEDDACVRILRNIRAAMKPGARVIVVEMLVGETGEAGDPGLGTLMDLNMLTMTSGRERELSEFDALLVAAGLRRTSVTAMRSPYALIEAVAA